FFGLDERGERDILDDLEQAGAYRRLMKEDDWEIEECHFAVCSCCISIRTISHICYSTTLRSRIRVFTMTFSVSSSFHRTRFGAEVFVFFSTQIPFSPPKTRHRTRSSTIHPSRAIRSRHSRNPHFPNGPLYPPPNG